MNIAQLIAQAQPPQTSANRDVLPDFVKASSGYISRGPSNHRRGAFHGMATASDAAVAHARARYVILKSYALVAAEIGVGASTVRDWILWRTRA